MSDVLSCRQLTANLKMIAGAEKNASGNSHLRGARINRSADVTPEEFNAFCAGLKAFLVSFETNNLSENNDK
ncbi:MULTISPECIES: hypothetical protein [Klebsiella pneumoniae complex]|uniref:hypothetical protein n=1 Tax=Klebsiella pneumoniae complex TaxID=3390273 RepID=UPI0009B982E9|nr:MULTISPECIES: hypothetical protein [Klebsiella]ELA2729854.1 hypothetical protein [Klebsiella pneumoniae]MBZ7096351.1 hypothetical protein [Klebsiella quasipneumoniae]RWS58125.1 hypothetical protein DN615_29130 [Klebsiella pneumoniae]UMI06492.1 hypothetical protein JJ465_26950 [Klebsiella pneumoniae]HBS3584590.1 hypothetical protein [Klebsiella pneumoniae]